MTNTEAPAPVAPIEICRELRIPAGSRVAGFSRITLQSMRDDLAARYRGVGWTQAGLDADDYLMTLLLPTVSEVVAARADRARSIAADRGEYVAPLMRVFP